MERLLAAFLPEVLEIFAIFSHCWPYSCGRELRKVGDVNWAETVIPDAGTDMGNNLRPFTYWCLSGSEDMNTGTNYRGIHGYYI